MECSPTKSGIQEVKIHTIHNFQLFISIWFNLHQISPINVEGMTCTHTPVHRSWSLWHCTHKWYTEVLEVILS